MPAVTAAEMERLVALLCVPSVSASDEHAADMVAAAELCADEVRGAGGRVEVRATARHPLVVGEVPPSDGRADAPRVLLYGHYDVQPPGPSELWTTPAFEPTVRDGALYARGASDDKGNLFMLLSAVRRLAEAGRLPVRAAVIVDGEEESGGTSVVDHLAADPEPSVCAIIFDHSMIGPGRPTFCTGVRGMVYLRVTVRTAAADAHSGLFGGAALNAAHALMAVLGAVVAREGRLPGPLAAGVGGVSGVEREVWERLPPGERVLEESGLRPADAMAAAEFYGRTLAAPSLDVHGLDAGEPAVIKTNLVARATATLSLRVAPGQSAAAAADALEGLLEKATPPGADLTIERLAVTEPAVVDPEAPIIRTAVAAIERAIGWPMVPLRSGGTLPVMAALAAQGVPTLLSGFGLPDDGIHAPDEHLRVEHLDVGIRAAEAALTALGSG
jgi:acetylornithine deacetylase/succinyl-diaminopimelate desuccinylase-like protein